MKLLDKGGGAGGEEGGEDADSCTYRGGARQMLDSDQDESAELITSSPQTKF